MRNFLACVVLVVALAGCVGKTNGTALGTSTISAAEISKQADGVATALSNLPKAPDANVQAQVANYAAWGAFLARAAAVVVGAL